MSVEEKTAGPTREMHVLDHLLVARKHLLIALLFLIFFSLLSVFFLAEYVLDFLTQPAGGLERFVAIEVTESVSTYMRVALLTGFIIALPFIFWQLYLFVAEALEPHEKKWVFLSIPVAVLLFLSGAAFAYYGLLRTALPFLAQFLEVETAWRISNYVNFVTSLIFWIGLAFETPLAVFLLSKLGLVQPSALARQWRIAIVVIAIAAAVITPTADPLTMGLTMAPLFAIYLLSVLFAYFGVFSFALFKQRLRHITQRRPRS